MKNSAPQSVLDLHGFSVEEARALVVDFLNFHLYHSHRVVMIVHGKGGKVDMSYAILKSYVFEWLKSSGYINALISAPLNEGGSGALKILLKRNLDEKS